VEIYTYDVTAARSGAAISGARSPWMSSPAVSAAGAHHVRTQHLVLAAGTQGTRSAASLPVPAMTMAARLLAEQPAVNGTRKQNVYKARIDAGGFGAMGPHPEREPA
jgi:hypothetical protein